MKNKMFLIAAAVMIFACVIAFTACNKNIVQNDPASLNIAESVTQSAAQSTVVSESAAQSNEKSVVESADFSNSIEESPEQSAVEDNSQSSVDNNSQSAVETETSYDTEDSIGRSSDQSAADSGDQSTGQSATEKSGITFKTLSVDGQNVYGKVANDQTTFSFLTEIQTTGDAKYTLSSDISGNDIISSKTIALQPGDNLCYILEYIGDQPQKFYTVTIRRRLLYTVTFDTDGGSEVEEQIVEEDSFATAPQTQKSGYTFVKWDHHFKDPIESDVTIKAEWQANDDTPYKVEYYLQNFEDDEYKLNETIDLTGTTDTTATAEIKAVEHYTATETEVAANIEGDGSTVLKVYYDIDKYTVKIYATDGVTIDKAYDGVYKYGYRIADVTATFNGSIGYEWLGWTYGEKVITSENVLQGFTVDKDVEYIATARAAEGFEAFEFVSDEIDCIITGIKDEKSVSAVIPYGVTAIDNRAFSYCNRLTSVTIPESVTVIGSGAFAGCERLTNIVIPDSVECIGEGAFAGAGCVESIGGVDYVGKWVVSYDGQTNNVTIRSGTIGIAEEVFYNKTRLRGVWMPDGLKIICDYAFYACTYLEHISIPDSLEYFGFNAVTYWRWLDDNIKRTGGAIYIGNENNPYLILLTSDDGELTSHTVNENCKFIRNNAFEGCEDLKSVSVPASVISIGDNAFIGCTSLQEIAVSEDNPAYKSINGDLYDKDGTTLIRYASGKNDLDLVIPDGVKIIECYALSESYHLETVVIPDSVVYIDSYAFRRCYDIESVTLGKGVKIIGRYAFSSNYGLKSIVFPESLELIYSCAFYNCELEEAIFSDPESWWGEYLFDENVIVKFDLYDPARNAAYLTDAYDDYNWVKTE